jgi:hypothetical protein
MIRKLMAAAVTGAAMLSLAGVAFATPGPIFYPIMPSNDIVVDNSFASVKTGATVGVTTGKNMQMGGMFSTPTMYTGAVSGVSALAESQVNTTILPGCACSQMGDISVKNMFTSVDTYASAKVVTGKNMQMGSFVSPVLSTGAVGSVGAGSSANVNYTQFTVTESI